MFFQVNALTINRQHMALISNSIARQANDPLDVVAPTVPRTLKDRHVAPAQFVPPEPRSHHKDRLPVGQGRQHTVTLDSGPA